MLEPTPLRNRFLCSFGNRSPGKRERPPLLVDEHLDPVRIVKIFRGGVARTADGQSRHSTTGMLLQQLDQPFHMARIHLRLIPLHVDHQILVCQIELQARMSHTIGSSGEISRSDHRLAAKSCHDLGKNLSIGSDDHPIHVWNLKTEFINVANQRPAGLVSQQLLRKSQRGQTRRDDDHLRHGMRISVTGAPVHQSSGGSARSTDTDPQK